MRLLCVASAIYGEMGVMVVSGYEIASTVVGKRRGQFLVF